MHSGKIRARGFLYLLVLVCMTLMTNACVKMPMFTCHPNYFDSMEQEAVGKEIIRLETTIDQDPEKSVKSASYFHLALLYAHYNNPTPDYSRSLSMFEKYLLLDPDSRKKNEALYMKTLLQELVETDTERTHMETKVTILKQNNEKITDKNAKLVEENKTLNDAIEKLKLLDLRLEEKRLNLK